MKITVKDLINVTGGMLICGSLDCEIKEGFINSLDNMNKDGSTFFGLKGSKKDGSLYYLEAIKNGAKVCVLDDIKNIKELEGVTIIIVDDTLKALQDLAEYKRSLFKGKVIGITGSIGKSTTKEMISNILEEKYKVLKTRKNENSKIGVPLTILRLNDEDVMIIEMGISKKGEMEVLSKIVKPDIAIITNILDSHTINFNNKKEIFEEKFKIIDYMNKGFLIVNNDDNYLSKIDKKLNNHVNLITCSINNKSNLKAYDIFEDLNTVFSIYNIKDIKINMPYEYIYNALLSFAVARIFNIKEELIKKGLGKKINLNHRLEIIKLNNNITLIDDSYNANYNSTKLALKVLGKYDKRKLLVLGDILELGDKSCVIHESLIEEIINNKIDVIITIGKFTKIINDYFKSTNIISKHFTNEKKSRKYIKNILKNDDVILFKASNSMNLVNIINVLKDEYMDNNN